MFDSVPGTGRNPAPEGGKVVHLLPEAIWITQLIEGDRSQPLIAFLEHKGLACLCHTLGVPVQNLCTSVFAGNRQALFLASEQNAGRQPHQVIGIREATCFIEVIYAPDKAPFDIAPCSKVLNMQVADGENFGSCGEVGANLRPSLRPTVKCSAKEREQ